MTAWKGIQMQDSELCKVMEADQISRPVSIGKGATRNVPVREGEEPEFHIEKVMCCICKTVIGTCDMTKFEAPIHGSLFLPKDHKHKYPPPFVRDFPWAELRCPMCNNRPFDSYNYFYNDKNEKCGLTVECPDCGRGFRNEQGLLGHKTHCEKPIRRY